MTTAALMQSVGVYRIDLYLNAVGALDVTFYFDQPATADPRHPWSLREFRHETPTRVVLEAIEQRCRGEQ